VAGLSLLVFWRGPNAVWGGVTVGFVGGLIVASIVSVSGHGFSWTTVGKGVVVGSLLGVGFELLGRVAGRWKA
jgi:hypothetical protein